MKKNSNYLFFRTDRVGDFLVSAILLKNIKEQDPNSFITIVTSEKNFTFAKTFDFVDNAILYPATYFKKVLFFIDLLKRKFDFVCVLDGKKRSIYGAILVKSEKKFLVCSNLFLQKIFKIFFSKIINTKKISSRISEIKEIINFLDFQFLTSSLDLYEKKKIKNYNIDIEKDFILFHFDEKWLNKDYISTYTSIFPENYSQLEEFLLSLQEKTGFDIVISTGIKFNVMYNEIMNSFSKVNDQLYIKKINEKNIFFLKDINIHDLEKLTYQSKKVICCHGAITHIASAMNKEIVDIFEEKHKNFYQKWVKHIRNYKFVFRVNFSKLKENILELL